MNPANSRIQSLKEMLSLEERRAGLQKDIDAIEQRMSALKDAIFSGSAATAAPSPSVSASRKTTQRASNGRQPRGLLKDKIMTALQAAGSEGVRVKDLAEALNTKAVNVHSWFHSNIKRDSSIKKISGGHYRLAGSSRSSDESAPAAAKPSAGRPKKADGRGGSRTGKRGQLSAKILDALKSAGSNGISVGDLSTKLGLKYKNVYIWFATTGKKNSQVKKVAPATYALVG